MKPIVGNDTGSVLLQAISANKYCPYNSYMITSIGGESIVLDPVEVAAKDKYDLQAKAIISSHDHWDHVDLELNSSYPDAELLMFKEGMIKTRDFKIRTIASSHSSDDIDKEKTSNVIIIADVDGLRIVHMGDCGQTFLTEEQLMLLDHVDVAITQFDNSYSNMTICDGKAFRVVDQINPKVVIPTHYNYSDLSPFEKQYGTVTEVNDYISLDQNIFSGTGINVYRILNHISYD